MRLLIHCRLLPSISPTSAVRYYIDPHHVVVVGRPSAQLAQKLEEEEKARIAKQCETLGPEGLKKAESELEDAKKEHDREIPKTILTDFPVPDVKSIAWIPVQSLQEAGAKPGRKEAVAQPASEDLKRALDADGPALPFFVQYDHVKVCALLREVISRGICLLDDSPTSSPCLPTSRSATSRTNFVREYMRFDFRARY